MNPLAEKYVRKTFLPLFFCPGCGTLIENEIAVKSDPVLRDIEVLADERLFAARPEAAD